MKSFTKKIIVTIAFLLCTGFAFAFDLSDLYGKTYEAHPTFFMTANISFADDSHVNFKMMMNQKVMTQKTYSYIITSTTTNYYEMDWYEEDKKIMSVKLTIKDTTSLQMKSSKGTFNLTVI